MTDEHPFIDDATIAAYLDGVSSPDVVARIELAVAKDLQFAEIVESMKQILEVSPQYPEWDTEQLWKVFAESTRLGNRTARQKMRVFSGQTLRSERWSFVAALVLIVVAIVVGWHSGVAHVSERVAKSSSVYTTGNGERANITLPDSSMVALNTASRLEVPADFVTGHRTVRLIGEGIFTVSHHSGTPFTVIAGSATARVLGTMFLVRHYATDSLTTVAVRDGKVAVRSVVLTAARQVVLGPVGMGEVQPADPAQFSFVTGVLVLNGVPFPKAIAELDRWYDADIRLGDQALASQRVAGQYAAGSLADLADILSGTYNVRVVRRGRVLTLFPR